METARVCNKCGEVNKVNKEVIKTEWVHDEFGNYYKATYIECVRCKERLILLLDTKRTNYLRKVLIALLKSGKDRARYDKTDAILTKKREEIKEKVNGLKLLDENENIFSFGLTFPKVGDIIESDL